jgi:protein MpaA
MKTESTAAGAALLARVQALGWPAIGQSVEGRPIHAGGPGTGAPPAPAGAVLVMAGIHGDERSSVEAVLDLLEWSASLPADGPPDAPWVVPALNPDGLLLGRKDSARGVDLNRNFPARNWSRAHPPGYDPGPAPLSEPETAAFAGLIERLQPRAVIAVHAPFACINHDGPAAAWAASVASACGWPAQADIGYPTPGSLGSWLGIDRGLPVLTIELPPGDHAAFRDPARRALAAAIRGPI